MNCKKCNNIIPEGSQICPFCGEALNSNDNVFDQSLNKIEEEFINKESSLTNPSPAENTPTPVIDTTSVDGVNLSGIDVFSEPNVGSIGTVSNVEVTTDEAPVAPVQEAPVETNNVNPVPTVEMAGNIFKNDSVTSVPKPIATPQATGAVNSANNNLEQTQTTLAEVIARTQAHQVVDPNEALTDKDQTISFKRPDDNKDDSKIFVFVVILLVLAAAGLVVYMIMKNKGTDTTKETEEEQTRIIEEEKERKKTEVEVKEKDANDIVIDEDATQPEDRHHVTTSESETNENSIPQTDIPNSGISYQGDGEDKSNDQSFFKSFTYGGIKFKVPNYLDVVLDSTGEYYITDNSSYAARFSLFKNGIKYIESNLTQLIAMLYTPLQIAPDEIKIFTTPDNPNSRIIGIFYTYDGAKRVDFIININDEVSAFYEVPVYFEGTLDYMLYDFDFISKNNQILGTFAKSNKAKSFENIIKGNLKTPAVR